MFKNVFNLQLFLKVVKVLKYLYYYMKNQNFYKNLIKQIII